MVAFSQGGVKIEEVSAKNPNSMVYELDKITKELTKEQTDEVTRAEGLEENLADTTKMLPTLSVFVKKACWNLIKLRSFK